MTENERQQRMVERILEDERLRGDLEDSSANTLINWASQRAAAAAADPSRPDDAVDADVQAIRKAAQTAARSGESDPARLLEVAQESLAKSGAPVASTLASAAPPAAEQHVGAAAAAAAQASAATAVPLDSAVAPQPAATAAPAQPQPAAADTSAPAPAIAQTAPTETRAPQEAAQAQPPSKDEAAPAAPAQPRSHRSTRSDGQSRRKRRRLAGYLKRARGGR